MLQVGNRHLSENTSSFQHLTSTMVSVTSQCMLASVTCDTDATTLPKKRVRKRKHVPHAQRAQTYVVKRNQRERSRVESVNSAFDHLRQRLPVLTGDQKISKINILRCAIDYINNLKDIVTDSEDGIGGGSGGTDALWDALQRFCGSNSDHDSDIDYAMMPEYTPDVPRIPSLATPSQEDYHKFTLHELPVSPPQGPVWAHRHTSPEQQCHFDQKPQLSSPPLHETGPWLQQQHMNNIDVMSWQNLVLGPRSSPAMF